LHGNYLAAIFMWLRIGRGTALIFIELADNRFPIRTIDRVHFASHTAISRVYQARIVTQVIQLAAYGGVTEETRTLR